jgi:hypothetical protein
MLSKTPDVAALESRQPEEEARPVRAANGRNPVGRGRSSGRDAG